MNKNDIKKQLQKGERLALEAKQAKTDVPKSVWESYSHFANKMGETILLGVFEDLKEKDSARRFRIEGVDDAEKIRKDFWNTINSNKVSDNILTDNDVEVVVNELRAMLTKVTSKVTPKSCLRKNEWI